MGAGSLRGRIRSGCGCLACLARLPTCFASPICTRHACSQFWPELLPLSHSYCHFIHLFYRRRRPHCAAPPFAGPLPLLSSLSCVECGLRFCTARFTEYNVLQSCLPRRYCCCSDTWIDGGRSSRSGGVSRQLSGALTLCCTGAGGGLAVLVPCQEPPATCIDAARGCTCAIAVSSSCQMAETP